MKICHLTEKTGQAYLTDKPCSYLIIHNNVGSVEHLKNADFTPKHQQARLWSYAMDTLTEANAQAQATAVYLL